MLGLFPLLNKERETVSEMNKNERIETRRARTPLETVVPLVAPYSIYIDPCGACNFKCSFCPCENSDYRSEDRFKTMSLELFQKIVDDMSGFPVPVKVVNLWSWGEPFMNPRLVDMIRYLSEKQVCNEIRCCTNGSFLNPEMNSKLVASGLDMLRISVEALDDAGYREITGVKVSFDRMVENIRDLYQKSRATKLKVSCKIVEPGVDTPEKVDRFYEIFSPISDYTFIEDIVDAFPGYDKLNKPDNSKVTFRKWNSYSDRANYVCAKPLVQMAIHSNGEVSACCNDWKFMTSYGNVARDNLVELWNSEWLKEFRLKQLELPRSKIPYCNICDCESDDDIDAVADIIAARLRGKLC